MRFATIDIGTNTVLLLIAEASPNGTLTVLRDDHAIARLGENVDRDNRISEAAYARFAEVMSKHQNTLKEFDIKHIAAFATSAMRDASNSAAIIATAKEDFDIDIELLSGDDEARWTYRGALLGTGLIGSVIGALDIGGGSTELSIGNGQRFERGVSMDMGAVRLTEKFFQSLPNSPLGKEGAEGFIRNMLETKAKSFHGLEALVAVAGTPTSLAAMHLGLKTFNHRKVFGTKLTLDTISQLLNELMELSPENILVKYPAVNKARVDILPAGTLILKETLQFLGLDSVMVSTRGLRYGIAIREAAQFFGEAERNWTVNE
jgi:exopolyphosphatase / guanosine-5'-triphosphate,3'-diphosphate pyrophosphatase